MAFHFNLKNILGTYLVFTYDGNITTVYVKICARKGKYAF